MCTVDSSGRYVHRVYSLEGVVCTVASSVSIVDSLGDCGTDRRYVIYVDSTESWYEH